MREMPDVGCPHESVRIPCATPKELERGYDECLRIARRTARNFYYSFMVLPRRERRAMCALYTFMRFTDDLGDGAGPVEQRRDALLAWRLRLDRSLGGEVDAEPWRLALADTVFRYRIPPRLLHAVIDGVQSDLGAVRFETFADLYRYCYRVASAVGLACIRIWGADDSDADLLAEWCGIAFQLTNILRDVAEDHRVGRIYLPLEDLRRFGVAERDLGSAEATAPFEAMMHFQIARAHDYYDRARPLERHLAPPGRAVLQVMTNVYRGLLRKIERRPAAVLSGRVALGRARKLAMVAAALPIRFLPDRRS